MIRLRSRPLLVLVLGIFAVLVLLILQAARRTTTSFGLDTLRKCPPVTIDEIETRSTVLEEISCVVDNVKTYQCYQDESSDEVYFPFNAFLKKHFDVSGKFVRGPNSVADHFEWWTSHARVRFPNFTHYDYHGVFGHFASYSVETRDRVRCISGQYGVPMSTQWSPVPYFYPIQIAQYALQHYSRLKTVSPSVSFVKGASIGEWNDNTPGRDGLRVSFDEKWNATRTEINAADYGISMMLDQNSALVVLSFYWMADLDGSFDISVKLVQTGKPILLHYVHSNDERCVWHDKESNESEYYYSLGAKPDANEWRWICRDLLVDTGRALASSTLSKKETILLHPGDVSVNLITFRGRSVVRDLKQRSSAHLEHFLVAADWLAANQDKQGGWSVPVERSIAEKRLVLPAGWHSAMAQGHALSVLTRAYVVTNDAKYLEAARRALRLFKTRAVEGGVLNKLFGYPWFEEYPTTPGTFVLNGFLYSLIGLYDFSQIISATVAAAHEDDSTAAALFSAGVESLRIFLPLFDTGSGTLYDLRHLGLKTAPNLARWDYHSVHIYLLKWLHIITNDELFNETANRWAAYASGHRAKHN